MITKAGEAVRRQFHGVDLEVLSHGPLTMVTRMLYKSGDRVPTHSHPNEQSGYVLSGRYIVTIGGDTHELKSGDSYTVPAGVEHELVIAEEGLVLDVFSPPRVDYL